SGAHITRLKIEFLEQADADWLNARTGDLILSASPHFYARLDEADDPRVAIRPAIRIESRQGDDRAWQTRQRLEEVLQHWKKDLKRVRLARRGLPNGYDDPFAVDEPANADTAATGMFDLMGKLFPFMLVLWSL